MDQPGQPWEASMRQVQTEVIRRGLKTPFARPSRTTPTAVLSSERSHRCPPGSSRLTPGQATVPASTAERGRPTATAANRGATTVLLSSHGALPQCPASVADSNSVPTPRLRAGDSCNRLRNRSGRVASTCSAVDAAQNIPLAAGKRPRATVVEATVVEAVTPAATAAGDITTNPC